MMDVQTPRRSGSGIMSRLSLLLLFVLFAATLPACQAARAHFLESELGPVVPRPPEGATLKVQIDPKYTTANLDVKFETQKPPAEIFASFQRELVVRGFSQNEGLSFGDPLPASSDAPPGTSPASSQDHFFEFKRGNDLLWMDFIQLSISWRSPTGPCEVHVILRHDSYLGQFALLPVTLPVAILLLPLLPWGEGYASLVYECSHPIVDFLY